MKKKRAKPARLGDPHADPDWADPANWRRLDAIRNSWRVAFEKVIVADGLLDEHDPARERRRLLELGKRYERLDREHSEWKQRHLSAESRRAGADKLLQRAMKWKTEKPRLSWESIARLMLNDQDNPLERPSSIEALAKRMSRARGRARK